MRPEGLSTPLAPLRQASKTRNASKGRSGASEGFREALAQLREQLCQLSELVDTLAARHESAVAGRNSRQRSSVKQASSPGPETGSAPAASSSKRNIVSLGDELVPEPDYDDCDCDKSEFDTFDSSSSFAPESPEKPEEQLRMAIESGDIGMVEQVLAIGVDPNEPFIDVQQAGLTLLSCAPLVLALIRGNARISRLLLESKASPVGEYSFTAGAEQILWTGSAPHCIVPKGDLALLQELVRFRASLENVTASNGATLMWQAAYFGKPEILRHLLQSGVDKERAAQSQDDLTLAHSPLHIAAKCGHSAAVAVLLEARACHNVEDGAGVSPLHDAIQLGHAGVVELLVAADADIFQSPPRRGSVRRGWRHIDAVFASNNLALMEAVARGLSRVPRISMELTRSDLIAFLSVPGNAPVDIWEAIFRPCSLRYWEVDGGRLKRAVPTAAYVDSKVGMGIALGPNNGVLQDYFKAKEAPPDDIQRFLGDLVRLSSPRHRRSRDRFLPVSFYACHLPFVHADLEVILAIADCERDEVFGVPGCRAIVQLKWMQERMGAALRMVLAFVEVVNLVMMNIIMNSKSKQLDDSHLRGHLLMTANVLACAVWVVASSLEVAQCIGYLSHGLVRRYVGNKRYLFDVVVLVLTGLVLGWTWKGGLSSVDSPAFRTCLGFVVGMKWARLLISLRQLKSVGLRILPIMDTMWDVGPFLFVLSVYFVGAVNTLYALGNHSAFDAFLVIYRLVVLGDVDLAELETGSALPSFSFLPDGRLVQLSTAATDYRVVVRMLMLVVSFLMGVSMMNLFVAMLCISYSEAAQKAPLAFERSRAHIVLDQYAARTGLHLMSPSRCCRRKRIQRGLTVEIDLDHSPIVNTPTYTWNSIKSLLQTTVGRDQLEQSAYVWFCLPSWQDSGAAASSKR